MQLSHTGMVFKITAESLRCFKGWYRYVLRDQSRRSGCPPVSSASCSACCQFSSCLATRKPRIGRRPRDRQRTSRRRRSRVGQFMWFAVLFCGFLVLVPNITTTAESCAVPWVKRVGTALCCSAGGIRTAFATSSSARRARTPRSAWFRSRCGTRSRLLKWAAALYNAAMGFSCWHVLAVNLILLPREAAPELVPRIGLVLGGLFFMGLSVISAYSIWNESPK